MNKNRLDIPVEGLQYFAHTIQEVLLDEAVGSDLLALAWKPKLGQAKPK